MSAPRQQRRAAVLALLAAVAGTPVAAAQRQDFLLPGHWLRVAAGSGGAWLLVAPDSKAPRTLLELRWRERAMRTLVEGLPAALDALVPAPQGAGGGPWLGGRGRLLAIDPQAAATAAPSEVGGALVAEIPDGRIATGAPPFLALASVGQALVVTPGEGGLRTVATHRLPVKAERESWGVALRSPSLSFVGNWLVAGPEQEGRLLRSALLGAHGERVDVLSRLPEPEHIAESAVVALGDRPLLVVGAFHGLGIASKKRLRVFALVAGEGGAPRGPLLAGELPGRAWQEMQILAADVDGDGRSDLVLVGAEGLTEKSVAITAYRTRGDGRLTADPATASVAVGGGEWRYGDVTGDGRPDLVIRAGAKLSVVAGGGRFGLPSGAAVPLADLPAPPDAGAPQHEVTVKVGTGGGEVSRTELERQTGWGLADLDGDGVLEVLAWAPLADGRTRLSVVGR
ncbi:MAG TPA: VCBS repeat-containing protein [Thermoanaerobaculia bacterium]|jgi:hypothetical protein|nr:VCBS repeat-containing protein [Thermoanaerobaculia bacterium]